MDMAVESQTGSIGRKPSVARNGSDGALCHDSHSSGKGMIRAAHAAAQSACAMDGDECAARFG